MVITLGFESYWQQRFSSLILYVFFLALILRRRFSARVIFSSLNYYTVNSMISSLSHICASWLNIALLALSEGSVADWFRALDLNSGGPWFKSFTLPLLFSVVLSSTPRSRCLNSQLVSLPPVGILYSLCSVSNIYLFTMSSISTTMMNTFDT